MVLQKCGRVCRRLFLKPLPETGKGFFYAKKI
jgi:hypothetical protein